MATTTTGKGEEVVAVEEVADVVEDAEVVEDDDEEDELAPLVEDPTVVVETTVFVTVLVAVDAGGGAGGGADGLISVWATEAIPAARNTTPKVIATLRKWRRGF
ncbi:MAG TPA: hypothetical protein VLX56_02885 [Nitrososphaerales archaeon]|nr:hypothetical protein [Nitrososphaerales archaeon]